MRNILLIALIFLFFACNKSGVLISQKWVKIPAGKSTLGRSGHRINPAHEANWVEFTISRFEVTNQEFTEFVKKTGYVTVAEKKHNALVFRDSLGEFNWFTDTSACWRFPNGKLFGGIESKLNHPVTCICMIDAMAYCQWKQVRLPIIDEWEIACRAGTPGKWFFGNTWDSAKLYANVWHKENHLALDKTDSWSFTSPVGSFKPNAWDIYDMYGNVFELCTEKPSACANNKNTVSARGGSWWCSRYSCNFVNSVDIGQVNKYASFSNLGFRVVLK